MTDIMAAAARSLIAFALAFFVTRTLSKQHMARLTYFDFTMAVCIGALIGHITNDYKEPFFAVVSPVVIFAALVLLIGWIALVYRPARSFLEGQPTVLIQNGKVLDRNMRRLRYNLDELNSQLRTKGFFDIGLVEFAILEPGGHLSVLPKSQHRPLTPDDLRVPTQYEGLSIELIMDGKLIRQNLDQNGLKESWLTTEIKSRGYDVADVYFAVLNSRGELFVDPFKDHIRRPVDSEGPKGHGSG